MIKKLLLKVIIVVFALSLIAACYFWINTLEPSDPYTYFFINYFDVLGIAIVLLIVALLLYKLVKKLYD